MSTLQQERNVNKEAITQNLPNEIPFLKVESHKVKH